MKYFALPLAVAVALCASRANSQTPTTLVNFSFSGPPSGFGPVGSLTLSGTTLYGMTEFGGPHAYGNIFSVGIGGTNYHNLVNLTGTSGTANGYLPQSGLTLSGTTLYGMTEDGGATGDGNIFSVGIGGTNFQNLVNFTGTSGSASGQSPNGGLTLSGTTLYGMTEEGGNLGYGNLFSVGTGGTNYKSLVSFTGTGGNYPGWVPCGDLTLSGTTFYGMTSIGGVNGNGNIFSVGTDGTSYHSLVSFNWANGAYPQGSLTLGGTTLYGMTEEGGNLGYGNLFSVGTGGTNYKSLVSFTGTSGSAIGQSPNGGLTLSGTTLYGMTEEGGAAGQGNIFSVGIDGSEYQNRYSFSGGTDGGMPFGDFTLSGGTLFGTGSIGGTNGDGTVFALTLPATPTPEPGTLALVAAAAVALVSYCWRVMRGRLARGGEARRL